MMVIKKSKEFKRLIKKKVFGKKSDTFYDNNKQTTEIERCFLNLTEGVKKPPANILIKGEKLCAFLPGFVSKTRMLSDIFTSVKLGRKRKY